MASLLRIARQGCQVAKANPALARRILQPRCFISTSKKNPDAATGVADVPVGSVAPKRPLQPFEEVAGPTTAGGQPEVHETVTGSWEEEKNWVSFGYELHDRDSDEYQHHLIMFAAVTCAITGFIYMCMYMPDGGKQKKWTMREGYLELERRRAAGLPLVDPNLVPVSRIQLPSDEELGDKDIVI